MENKTEFILNNNKVSFEAPEDTPLLWIIREEAKLTGTKFGCGKGLCGACTVHLNGQPIRSCITPIAAIKDQKINTIESLKGDQLHPVQVAWEMNNVPQCGYCQSGQIMTAVALLEEIPNPTDNDINNYMSGILCRCGTYQRIKKAIHDASEIKNEKE